MFEYQSLICELTGMDVANASLYDGATALGEAALMCSRITKRKTFIVPTNISPEERSVLKNYCLGAGIKIKEVPYDKETGKISLHELRKESSEDTAGICIQNPNFFGVFEDEIEEINRIAKEKDSLFVVSVDPLSLGIVKSPGDYGADIVFGEGKGLGNPLDFGGSTLGFFACKREFLRQLPGRIIGMTKDKEGRRAFCMTMQTREQHIRRGKATSNICTNEGLCALSALVYLSWLGEKGLYELGKINFERGKELFEGIISIRGFERVFTGIHFNEFVVRCKNAHKESKKLLSKGIQGGLILDYLYPELKNCMLFGVTELHSSRDIEKLLSILKEI
jgi:glycine dehydrogenase subunit 1